MHTLSGGATQPAVQPGKPDTNHFVNRRRCPGPFMTPSVLMPNDSAGCGHSNDNAPCWRVEVCLVRFRWTFYMYSV